MISWQYTLRHPWLVALPFLLAGSENLPAATLEATLGPQRIPELTWIDDPSGFLLESSSTVSGPWTPLATSEQERESIGSRIRIRDIRPGFETRFYRLFRPGQQTGGTNSIPQRRPGPAYDTGNPDYKTIYVDPVAGHDENDGSSPSRAFLTLTGAWRSLPEGAQPRAVRIALLPGIYAGAYMEDRRGSTANPILIEPVSGPGTVEFRPTPQGDSGSLQFLNCSHVYLQDMRVNVNGGDGVHFENCDHMLIRRMRINSARSEGQDETVKVNQSQHIYIEDSEISDAGDNCIDVVAAQFGHVVRCKIHNSNDWGFYLKGGSAYWVVEGNEIYNCGTGGFTAGQGTGFQFMKPPWIHYETYDIKVINNLIHHTEGAGLGVNGSYNVLMAHNTLYHVGTRSHAVEFVHGRRGCDGLATNECQPLLDLGGWGSTIEEEQFIPNQNIFFLNNLIYNPPGIRSAFQHFEIRSTATPPRGSNVPLPARADAGLIIRGNLIWNGPSEMPLGNEDENAGCRSGDCTTEQLLRDNRINAVEPVLNNPPSGDYHPKPGNVPATLVSGLIPDFSWSDAPSRPAVPIGTLANRIDRDWTGELRGGNSTPGAFAPRQP